MNDRNGWENWFREIRAVNSTWWWWWYICIYIYIYIFTQHLCNSMSSWFVFRAFFLLDFLPFKGYRTQFTLLFTQSWRWEDDFMLFFKGISAKKTAVSSRIGNQAADSILYYDKLYSLWVCVRTPMCMCVCVCVCVCARARACVCVYVMYGILTCHLLAQTVVFTHMKIES